MKRDEFKDTLFKEAIKLGFTDCEIHYASGKSFKASIFKGEVSEYKNAVSVGIAFRGKYKGQMGYAYTEKMDESIIPVLLDSAKQNAEIIEDEDKEELFSGSSCYMEIDSYNDELNNVSVIQKINSAKEMEDYALSLDKRVKSVSYCVVGSGEEDEYIANTLGLSLYRKNNYIYAYIYVQVEQNSQVKVAGEVYLGRDYKSFSPKNLAEKAVNKALSYLGASSVETKKYPVVFNNETTVELLSQFTRIFFAETVQKGFSLLKDKLNTKIASDVVNINDDGVFENSLGNVSFDSEGVATYNKTIVEKGILKSYLYNLKSAKKDGVESTGNGFKAGYKSSIGTACTNFYIVPSKASREQMLKNMKNGILITELSGLHAGANSTTGDFSLSADGFVVENGEIVRPVEQITVAGNIFEMLNNITEVASDLWFDMPSAKGTIGSPSIFVKELSVSGM